MIGSAQWEICVTIEVNMRDKALGILGVKVQGEV